MNILFFNRSFYPDVEATGQFLTELCEDLSKYGHNVTIVAGRPYYMPLSDDLFLINHEKYNLINIIRVNNSVLPKENLFFRIINLSLYFLLAFFGGFLVKGKPDIVVAQTDPPVLGILGAFFSKWYKCKFIFACKDIYPELGIATGKLKSLFLNLLLKKINLFSFKVSNKITCLSEDMKKIIINKGIESKKIHIIRDWADTKDVYPVTADENPFREKFDFDKYFTLMHSGNIGLTQALEDVIEVACHFDGTNDKIRFMFVGEGANKSYLKILVSEYNLTNVGFLPYQSKSELRFSLCAPDIHLVTLSKGLSGLVAPSKVYNILASGKPYVAWLDEDSEIFEITREYKCGIAVPAGDIKAMVKAVEWAFTNKHILKELGENGRNVATKYFDREKSTQEFNKMLLEFIPKAQL